LANATDRPGAGIYGPVPSVTDRPPIAQKPEHLWDYHEREFAKNERYWDLVRYLRRNGLPDGPPSIGTEDASIVNWDMGLIRELRRVAWLGHGVLADMFELILDALPEEEEYKRTYLVKRIASLRKQHKRWAGNVAVFESALRDGKRLPEFYPGETAQDLKNLPRGRHVKKSNSTNNTDHILEAS